MKALLSALFAVMIAVTFAGSTYAAEEKKMDAPAAAPATPAAPAAPAATPAVGGEMKKEEKKQQEEEKKDCDLEDFWVSTQKWLKEVVSASV